MRPWKTLLLGLGAFLVLQASVQNFRVQGQSMDPTLANQQHLLVSKLAYAVVPFQTALAATVGDPGGDAAFVFNPPQRGDIVVFHIADREGADLVKRVIGLPGETVELRDGRVFIDGELLPEPYLTGFDDSDEAPLSVPAGHYYVLGDNRAVSYDSRFMGPIPMEQIIGKAWVSYWPLDPPRRLGRRRPAPAVAGTRESERLLVSDTIDCVYRIDSNWFSFVLP